MVAFIKVFMVAALQQACSLYDKLLPHSMELSAGSNNTCTGISLPSFSRAIPRIKYGTMAGDEEGTVAAKDAPTITVNISGDTTPDRTVDVALPTEAPTADVVTTPKIAGPPSIRLPGAAAQLLVSIGLSLALATVYVINKRDILDKLQYQHSSVKKVQVFSSNNATSIDSLKKGLNDLTNKVLCQHMTNNLRMDMIERKESQNIKKLEGLAATIRDQALSLDNQAATLESHNSTIEKHTESIKNHLEAISDHHEAITRQEDIIKAITLNHDSFHAARSEWEDSVLVTEGIVTSHTDEIAALQDEQENVREYIVALCNRKEVVINARIKHLTAGRQALIRMTEQRDAKINELSKALQEERAEKEQVVTYLRGHTFTNDQANKVFKNAVDKAADGQMAPLSIGYMKAVSVQLGAADKTTRAPLEQPIATSTSPGSGPRTPRPAAASGMAASKFATPGARSPASIPPHLRK